MISGILQKNEIKHHSQPVTDIKSQVIPHIKIMAALCKNKIGVHSGALALAHCQVEKDNPMTFFVFADGSTIVNPRIITKRESFMHKEGCLSIAMRPEKKVKRFKEINVSYTYVKAGKITEYPSIAIDGIESCVFQHEIGHFTNNYIY